MPSVEERLATLEGRVQEQAAFMADVRGSAAEWSREIRREMDQRFDQVDRRFEQIDRRFAEVDRRFEQVDRRFEQIDQRFEQVDQRFDQMDRRFDRMERQLTWMLGTMLTGFAAVMTAVLSIVFRT